MQLNFQNQKLGKQDSLFETENIDKPNIITIALNPKEYYERFNDHSDNKKHKGKKKSTPDMDFDSYSAHLSDLTEQYGELLKPGPEKIEQKRFQVINESMQMKSISKLQFGYLDQNLTDTDSTSMFFVVVCDLQSNIREDKARNVIFEVMLKSKIFDRLDLSTDYFAQFNCPNQKLRKQDGLFEIENIDKPNITTIALNPKEYYERFNDHSDNKKHKGLKKQFLIWILILTQLVYQI